MYTNNSTGIINNTIISGQQIATLIVPYSLIFLLAIIGNSLVIVTLAANRRMRSVTNMFLLNLAVSDLLLGVFCMPFTLAGVLLKQFIFGPLMCSLISYLQAVSVSVSAWTLVVMSVERYYAICHPLKSRESRQTVSHAYKMIALVWISSLVTMAPIGIVSKLHVMENTGNFKCRESWPSVLCFEAFTIFLDIILLIVPLIIMSLTYTSIAITLKNNLKQYTRAVNDDHNRNNRQTSAAPVFKQNNITGSTGTGGTTITTTVINGVTNTTTTTTTIPSAAAGGVLAVQSSQQQQQRQSLTVHTNDRPPPLDSRSSGSHHRVVTALRSTANPLATEAQQRRIVKMLFVVVLEFFLCWTPIYTINTIIIYAPAAVYRGLGYQGISFFHLLAFFSSCTNPITYCFMNSKFRQSFLQLFRWCRRHNNNNGGPANNGMGMTSSCITNGRHLSSTGAVGGSGSGGGGPGVGDCMTGGTGSIGSGSDYRRSNSTNSRISSRGGSNRCRHQSNSSTNSRYT
ncbi:QRFP-like peptide receptor [Oppia nitens]|uniref:QRFP-like peptide receptor n=1 Tax=Oppia nitens TaxID=1686743 RepID=UPI0023DBD326|nr:QRFP-like peptide receptor [Oppia nitens]